MRSLRRSTLLLNDDTSSVKCIRSRVAEMFGTRRHLPQAPVRRNRRAINNLHIRKATRLQQVLQRLRMDRLHVRQVADEALEKRHPARRD